MMRAVVKNIRCAQKSNVTRKSEEEVCLQELQDWPGLQLISTIADLHYEGVKSFV